MQSEFLVMTEKNISAYKLFLSLNIWDFNWFFMWKLQRAPEKVSPSFPATPSKSRGPVKPPFFKIWLEVQPPAPPPSKKRGVHTMLTQTMSLVTILLIIAIITIIRLHPTVIDPTNKVVILNDWKVKFKIKWKNVFIYKYVGNKYENYVTMDGNWLCYK